MGLKIHHIFRKLIHGHAWIALCEMPCKVLHIHLAHGAVIHGIPDHLCEFLHLGIAFILLVLQDPVHKHTGVKISGIKLTDKGSVHIKAGDTVFLGDKRWAALITHLGHIIFNGLRHFGALGPVFQIIGLCIRSALILCIFSRGTLNGFFLYIFCLRALSRCWFFLNLTALGNFSCRCRSNCGSLGLWACRLAHAICDDGYTDNCYNCACNIDFLFHDLFSFHVHLWVAPNYYSCH